MVDNESVYSTRSLRKYLYLGSSDYKHIQKIYLILCAVHIIGVNCNLIEAKQFLQSTSKVHAQMDDDFIEVFRSRRLVWMGRWLVHIALQHCHFYQSKTCWNSIWWHRIQESRLLDLSSICIMEWRRCRLLWSIILEREVLVNGSLDFFLINWEVSWGEYNFTSVKTKARCNLRIKKWKFRKNLKNSEKLPLPLQKYHQNQHFSFVNGKPSLLHRLLAFVRQIDCMGSPICVVLKSFKSK